MSLVLLYCFMALYLRFARSQSRSSTSRSPIWCASEDTCTTRAGAEACSRGMSSLVRRKWPRWFVCGGRWGREGGGEMGVQFSGVCYRGLMISVGNWY